MNTSYEAPHYALFSILHHSVGYVTVLLQQQLERKNKLQRELRKEKENLRAMQREVHEMRRDLEQRQRCKQTMSPPVVSSVVLSFP
jgi:uncharacterized membrane-anchored protein YhcB (DUF1043 family)